MHVQSLVCCICDVLLAYLQNKSFIYCGKPFGEEDVSNTIKKSYPASEFRQTPPKPDELKTSKSFLLVTEVKPVSEDPFKDKKIHYNIPVYFKYNAIDTFTYQKVSVNDLGCASDYGATERALVD